MITDESKSKEESIKEAMMAMEPEKATAKIKEIMSRQLTPKLSQITIFSCFFK